MYAYLKGKLIEANSSTAIVEIMGIGYSLSIPCRLLGDLPPIGETVQFFTSFVVRELSQTLYGFLSPHERDLFEALIDVTGIGPKLGLSLIGHLTIDQLYSAISNNDFPSLCKVPGVGKKTAERLVVELKDKLAKLIPLQAHLSQSLHATQSQRVQDAMLALINLGYNQNNAQKALKETLKNLSEEADLALLITTALKHI